MRHGREKGGKGEGGEDKGERVVREESSRERHLLMRQMIPWTKILCS